jgi:hypothetical protein
MMKGLTIIFCVLTLGVFAQPKKVTETVAVTGQSLLDLEFTFADDIIFKTWDKKEVLVEVEVEINNGEDNDIFTLESDKTATTIYVEMDKDMWKKIEKSKNNDWNCCSHSTKIYYTVYLPKNMQVKANTISGNYQFEYFGTSMKLKTISGEIDITVPEKSGFDFRAKTISGEVYSNVVMDYPDGKEGLRQIVGQNFKARINNGGEESLFETISGNIYLRKE